MPYVPAALVELSHLGPRWSSLRRQKAGNATTGTLVPSSFGLAGAGNGTCDRGHLPRTVVLSIFLALSHDKIYNVANHWEYRTRLYTYQEP